MMNIDDDKLTMNEKLMQSATEEDCPDNTNDGVVGNITTLPEDNYKEFCQVEFPDTTKMVLGSHQLNVSQLMELILNSYFLIKANTDSKTKQQNYLG